MRAMTFADNSPGGGLLAGLLLRNQSPTILFTKQATTACNTLRTSIYPTWFSTSLLLTEASGTWLWPSGNDKDWRSSPFSSESCGHRLGCLGG